MSAAKEKKLFLQHLCTSEKHSFLWEWTLLIYFAVVAILHSTLIDPKYINIRSQHPSTSYKKWDQEAKMVSIDLMM